MLIGKTILLTIAELDDKKEAMEGTAEKRLNIVANLKTCTSLLEERDSRLDPTTREHFFRC